MKFPFRLFLLIFLATTYFFVSCKPNKGIDDPIWKEESQKMAISICQHLNSCLEEKDWEAIPEKWRGLAQNRMQEGNCQNEFRKSPIFFLKVPDVTIAKEAYTKCTQFTLALTCEQLKSKTTVESKDCLLVNSLQSGNP